MSDFREIVKFRPFFEVQKNFKLLNFRHVVYHFEACNLYWRIRIYSLFPEIFKCRENISNNRFLEIHKSFLKVAKFEFIYL